MRRPPYLPIFTVLLVAFGVVGMVTTVGRPSVSIAPQLRAQLQEAAFAGCTCEQRGGEDCWQRLDSIVGPVQFISVTPCDPISTESICIGPGIEAENCVVTAYRPTDTDLPPICSAEHAASLEAGYMNRLNAASAQKTTREAQNRAAEEAYRWFREETKRIAAGAAPVSARTTPSCIIG